MSVNRDAVAGEMSHTTRALPVLVGTNIHKTEFRDATRITQRRGKINVDLLHLLILIVIAMENNIDGTDVQGEIVIPVRMKNIPLYTVWLKTVVTAIPVVNKNSLRNKLIVLHLPVTKVSQENLITLPQSKFVLYHGFCNCGERLLHLHLFVCSDLLPVSLKRNTEAELAPQGTMMLSPFRRLNGIDIHTQLLKVKLLE